MDFAEYLNTADLAVTAEKALAVLRNQEGRTQMDVMDAYATLRPMRLALTGLKRHHGTDGDIPAEWLALGRETHTTLVRNDKVGSYWETLSVDLGIISPEAKAFLGKSVDWYRIGCQREKIPVVFEGYFQPYWIFAEAIGH